jgi:peptidoglycan/xylan/chitin deacetylase (PgdA/CDA1 family)
MLRLPHHGRYEYSAINRRPNYSWPQGKRLAVHVALNIEHFAYAAGIGHSMTAELPQPDPRTFCWRDYGNRVGFWRLMDVFDELNLPTSCLINSTVFDYAPEIVKRICARKDEIIGHGRTNAERQGQMWEADEARFIAEVRDAIVKHSGQQPGGWMGPWMSQSAVTPDLLHEAGFKFIMDWPCDDQPIWLKTRKGRIMSVPYSIEINDSPQILVRHHTAEQFEHMIIDQFDEMIDQSEKQPLVCGIALHTMICGEPYRVRAVRRALKHIVEHPKRDKVWFTRPGEIYAFCASLPAGTVPGSELATGAAESAK